MRTRYTNAKAYLGHGHYCDNFIVEDDKFLSLCTSEDDEVDMEVDLHGKVVLPGFVDSHLHVYGTGKRLSFCDLRSITSINELISKKNEWIKRARQGVIIGYNWNQDHFEEKRLPTKHDLDEISKESPIVFGRVCGHIAVLNSKALEVASITQDTPSLEGGTIDFKKGILYENAQSYLKKIYPPLTLEDVLDYYKLGIKACQSLGITTTMSNDIGLEGGSLTLEAIQEIYRKERPLRLIHKISSEDPASLDHFLQSKREAEDIHLFGPIKLFKDGTLGARTSLMKEPYKDDPTTGISTITQEKLEEMVIYGEKTKRNVMVHAIGDKAISDVLDAFETHMTKGNPLGHAVVHGQITSMDELKRAADLRVPILYQPIFLDYDLHIVESRVGKALASTSYAFKTFKDLGGIMAFGSDAPVDSLNPFEGIQCALTRQDLKGNPTEGYNPNEALSLNECIEAYTKTSAKVCGLEGITGEIKEGLKADFIVLDRDIFNTPIHEIKNTKVLATYFEGRLVHGGL